MVVLVLRQIRGWGRFRDLIITEYSKWSRIKKQNRLFISTYWVTASAATINDPEKEVKTFCVFRAITFHERNATTCKK